MSTQTQSTIVGLAASGLFWLATPVAEGQGRPAPQAPPSSQAAPASPTYSVLLLTRDKGDKVVHGTITRDPSGSTFILKKNGVPIAYPAIMVAKAAGSVEELYQYRLTRLAERDPDERMKLALWCLSEGLPDRAKEQIAAILEMCPGDRRATQMQFSMAASEERAMLDTSVRQVSGEVVRDEAPATINPRTFKQFRGDYGRDVLPRIFDLPQAVAVERARDFTYKVHPILQKKCANCHDERYQGSYQLVVAKTRRDMTPDVARSNLDATLRLVNPDDLTRSDLLTAGLVPHGPSKDAIFRGPNDLDYRVLDAWVRALRPTSVGRDSFAGLVPNSGDGFAADRRGMAAPTGPMLTPVVPIPPKDGFPPLPGAPINPQVGPMPGYLPGQSFDLNKDYSGGLPDSAFRTPYAAGNELPPEVKAAQQRANAAGATRATPPAALGPAAVVPTTATKVNDRTVLVEPTDDPTKLPGMNQPRYPPKKPEADAGKKTKPAEINGDLIEQLIKNRNGTP